MDVKKIGASVALVVVLAAGSCEDDATIATQNLTKAADNFEINRRVVFYNGITDRYILTVEGRCSMDLNLSGTAFNVICKVGPSEYKRHSLVLSNNTSAFVEQMEPVTTSAYHYRVTFKPQSIIPDVDFRGSAAELTTNTSEAQR